MPYQKINLAETPGVLDRVLLNLQGIVEQDERVDIVTFCESPDYLGIELYPRQRLLLKLYYRIPLGSSTCWCKRHTLPKGYPSICNFCAGTGVYDEIADVRKLLSRENRYAKLFFPGLDPAYVPGMSDDALRERLLDHGAFVLSAVAGRRGSKSVMGAIIDVYELYTLVRDPDPHGRWEIIRHDIGVANAATDEEQAKILYGQMVALIENSPWFARYPYRALETRIEFTGRRIFGKALHSNSSSIRGQALKAVNIDEYWHFNKTTGKLSDKAMWAGLAPSVVTFKEEARIVLTSSPLNKSGQMWEIYDLTEKGIYHNAIVVQLATWEMNPNYPRESDFIISQYALDSDYAEQEFGAQITEQVGYYIPWDAIDACVNSRNARTVRPEKGYAYHLHIDMSSRKDSTGLTVHHYEPATGTVVADLIMEFDPKDAHSAVTKHGEIDHDMIYAYVFGEEELPEDERRGMRGLVEQGYRFRTITFDQYNSDGLVQRFRRKMGDRDGERVFKVPDTDKNNRNSYSALRTLITQGAYRCYEHARYKHQLKMLGRTVKDSGQWKVEAPPGEHDDLTDSAAVSAMLALEYAQAGRSGIHVVELNSHLRPEFEPPQESPIEDLRHHPDCARGFCVFACPVSLALRGVGLPK